MAKQFHLALIFVSLATVTSLRADIASVLMASDLEQWAALSLGLAGNADRLQDSARISGNFGAGGRGDVALADQSLIDGALYLHKPGWVRLAAGASLTGNQYREANTLLDAQTAAAFNLSRHARSLAATRALSQVDLNHTADLTLSGAPGETVVLNLGLFRLRDDATLTLQGSAKTTFVINVSRGFLMSDNAKIVFSGGLDWNNVIFNVRGIGRDLALTGNASFQGILLANRRALVLRDAAILRGQAIVDSLNMRGAAQINHPLVISP